MDLLAYWGLRERPFENTRSPKFFFPDAQHLEALERLLYVADDGNMEFGLLTGEIGSGKTITRTVFQGRLAPERFVVAALDSANFPFEQILAEVLAQALEVKPAATLPEKYRMVKGFRAVLKEKIAAAGRHLVVILDEAQEVPRETLLELKNLTNLGDEDRHYLTIILVGQPDLRDRLRELPQIDQRVSLRYHLNPLAAADVPAYLAHRLKVAGRAAGDLFAPPAADAIYRETFGVPREVNRIAKLALDAAYSRQAARVDEPIVAAIIRDLRRQAGRISP